MRGWYPWGWVTRVGQQGLTRHTRWWVLLAVRGWLCHRVHAWKKIKYFLVEHMEFTKASSICFYFWFVLNLNRREEKWLHETEYKTKVLYISIHLFLYLKITFNLTRLHCSFINMTMNENIENQFLVLKNYSRGTIQEDFFLLTHFKSMSMLIVDAFRTILSFCHKNNLTIFSKQQIIPGLNGARMSFNLLIRSSLAC